MSSTARRSLAGFACFAWVAPVLCANPTALCGIVDERAAIVGNNLYWASGNQTFDDGLPWHNDSHLFSLDLTKQLDISGPIPLSALQQSNLPTADLSNGKTPISGGYSGAFFYDHTMLYAYAGLVGENSGDNSNALWSYNTTDSSWSSITIEGGEIAFQNGSDGVYASDPGSGLSFYTGGYIIGYNNTNDGLVRFDSSSPADPQWNFATTQTGLPAPSILKGAMVYVRKGKAGVLIAFGGFNTTHKGSEFSAGWDWDYRTMDRISVYDVFSNIWYEVEADGDVPDARGEFCAAVSAAPDDSSFQIVMYGGYDLLADQTLGDVYILSIPSFTWIKANPTNDPDLKIDKSIGRNRHICQMWKESQMVVVGGLTPYSSDVCNKTYPPIKILDTVNFKWLTGILPNVSEYTVPSIVQEVIGGNSTGGATRVGPTDGWSNSALSGIFSQTVPRDTYQPPGSSSSSSPTSGPTSGPSSPANSKAKKSAPAGAIAGGVIGGLACLALIGVIAWLVVRRRSGGKQQSLVEYRKELPNDSVPGPPVYHEVSGSHYSKFHLEDHQPVHELPNSIRPAEMYGGPGSPRVNVA